MFDEGKEIFDEKELDTIRVSNTKFARLRRKSRLYSSRRDTKRKSCKYTIKLYDAEYELIKDQVKQLNMSLQRLLDFLLLDGFLKKDPRVIEFINDCIRVQSEKFDRTKAEIDRFSILDMQTLIEKIERE
jgi:hypothetical protein